MRFFALFFVVFACCSCSLAYAQGMEGSPVSTPATRADALKRSQEMYAQIERENAKAAARAAQNLRHEAIIKGVMSGSTAQYEIEKTYPVTVYDPKKPDVAPTPAKKSIVSKIQIPASVPRTAGALAKGAGSALIGAALFDLLGKSVDWLLDPDNHQVVYYDDAEKTGAKCYKATYFIPNDLYPDGNKACKEKFDMLFEQIGRKGIGIGGSSYGSTINGKSYTLCMAVDLSDKETFPKQTMCEQPKEDKDEKAVDLDTIAEILHKFAEQNHADAQNLLDALAKQVLNSGELDDLIKANAAAKDKPTSAPTATTSEADTGSGSLANDDEEATPSAKTNEQGSGLAFPTFCSWASVVCDFIEWVKTEPELENEPPPTQDITLKDPSEFDKQHINAGSQCPPDVARSFYTGFGTHEIRFEIKPICDFVGVYIRPVIVFLAYVFAAINIGNAFKVG